MKLSRVRIDEIHEAPFTGLLSYGRGSLRLEDSIREFGLINPIHLRVDSGGRYTLVCGLARLNALRALRMTRVDAILRDGLDERGAFETALRDNVWGRGFNEVEKAGAVHYILRVLRSPDSGSERLLRLLPVPVNPKAVSRYLRLFDSPDDVKRLIVGGILSFNSFVLMSRMGLAEARSIRDVIDALRPGTNYQRDLIYLCEDIAARRRIPIPDVLESGEIRSVLSDENLPGPDRMKRLIELLRAMRSGPEGENEPGEPPGSNPG